VEILVSVKDENGNQALIDYEIAEESLTMLFAGHDTTKNELCWTLYFLGQNRKEMEKLQNEVDRELKGRTPTHDDLPSLPFCKKAIMESLRLRPPVAFVHRETTSDIVLGGIKIPKRTALLMSTYRKERKGEIIVERKREGKRRKRVSEKARREKARSRESEESEKERER